MVTVTIQIDIAYPATKTFDYIANPENNPDWQKGMKKCTITTDGPWGMGSEYHQLAEFMGKDIITTFKITEFEENHFIKGASMVSTFPITFKRIVTGDESVSHVNAIITGEPKGFLKMIPMFTKWMINKSINRDYQNLKRMLEGK